MSNSIEIVNIAIQVIQYEVKSTLTYGDAQNSHPIPQGATYQNSCWLPASKNVGTRSVTAGIAQPSAADDVRWLLFARHSRASTLALYHDKLTDKQGELIKTKRLSVGGEE